MASIGLAQLRKLDLLQEHRRKIWERYQQEFAGITWMARPQDPGKSEQHSYFTYFVRIAGGKRDAFAKYLYENGIYTTLRYHPLHMNPIYKSKAKLSICERLNEEGLNLPIHPNLSADDVDHIVKVVGAFNG
jgi:dTDP-4-amino-4,6-dideoxygalactose transaminase